METSILQMLRGALTNNFGTIVEVVGLSFLGAMVGCAAVWKCCGLLACLNDRMDKLAPRVRVALLLMAGAVVLIAVPKNTNGVQGANAPLQLPSGTLQSSDGGDSPAGDEDAPRIIVADVEANGMSLVLHRPESMADTAVEVVLAGSTNLVAATWEAFTNVTFAAGETNHAVFVDRVMLDAHWVDDACFFAFIQAGDDDGDGLDNWFERFNSKTASDDTDTDDDGMPDGWEWTNHFDPNFAPDALADSDGDGIPNLYEYHHGTDPWRDDAESIPKIVAGGTGENSVTNLAAALRLATPYSIVEVADGVHQGTGWSGIFLPEFPVLVTSPDYGRSRRAVIRSDVSYSSVFYLAATQTTHTVVQGLRIELAATNGQQQAFFVGGNTYFTGGPAAATFRNITVRMMHPGVQYNAWMFRHYITNRVIVAGCTVNAAGATYARGIAASDSPPMSVENCSFINFPPDGPNTTSVGIQYESTALNFSHAPEPICVEVVNCLFDRSFSDAYPWAFLTNGVSYQVAMANCLVPAEPEYLPNDMVGLVVTNSFTDWTGHVSVDSPARNAGQPILFSIFDMDGECWPELPPIGADAYSQPGDDGVDTDGDGLSDFDERTVHGTDPYSADSDGDGVSDAEELDQLTNPLDVSSWKRKVVMAATNIAWTASGPNTVSYCGLSTTPTGWNVDASEEFGPNAVVTNFIPRTGAVYAKAFTDINLNGVYDPETDILVVEPLGFRPSQTVRFKVGDVDGDDVSDAQERLDGTNPYDSNNFRVRTGVVFTDLDCGHGISNFWAVAETTNSLAASGNWFGEMIETAVIDQVTTNGVVLMGCCRDVDGNRTFTENVDICHWLKIWGRDNGKTINVLLGDCDADGVPDSEEVANGTNPTQGASCCFNLQATVKGIISTSNALCCAACWGAQTVIGPTYATGTVMTFNFGHLEVGTSERATIRFWDDVNGNMVLDDGEISVLMTFVPQGHENVVTNAMPLGAFDSDEDGMPDYWEQIHGIGHGSARDGLEDSDGDGFIDLHEFWAGTSPTNALENGSNTVLYAMSHAVDDRIAGKTPSTASAYYENYSSAHTWITSPSNAYLTANANCWMADVDLSCLAVWNTVLDEGAYPRQMTAISPWHVITATHMGPSTNMVVTFRSHTGEIYVRRIIDLCTIPKVAEGDFSVGILDSALPQTIHPAILLPEGYESYIGNGHGLPLVRIGKDKSCSIQDIVFLSPSRTVSRIAKVEYPIRGERRSFIRGPIRYDSGHPNFLLYGNQAFYLYPTRGYREEEGCAVGYLCVYFKKRIQGAMDLLSRRQGTPCCTLEEAVFNACAELVNSGE